MAIEELIEIRAEGSQAEQESAKVGDALKKAFDDAEKSAGKLGKTLSEDDKILARFQADLKRHADALRMVEKGNEALAAKQEQARLGWERFAKGVAAASVALAIWEAKRAMEALLGSIASSITPLERVNREWTAMDKTLASIKSTIEDPEFQKLGIFEKILAAGWSGIDTRAVQAQARGAQIAGMAKERELRSGAEFELGKTIGGEGTEDLTSAFKSKFKDVNKERRKDAADAAKKSKEEFESLLAHVLETSRRMTEEENRAAEDAGQKYIDDERSRAEELSNLRQERKDKMLEYAEKEAAGVAEIAESNNARLQQIDRNRQEQQKQQFDAIKEYAEMVASAATNSVLTLFDEIAEGQAAAGEAFVGNMLKQIGSTLLGKGNADMVAAIASGLIYGNWAGVGAAGAEIALGAGMAGGGSVIGADVSKKRDAQKEAEMEAERLTRDRAKGGGDSASSFAAGGGSWGGSRGKEGGDTINITITGPVLSDHHFGLLVTQALNEKKRRGL